MQLSVHYNAGLRISVEGRSEDSILTDPYHLIL